MSAKEGWFSSASLTCWTLTYRRGVVEVKMTFLDALTMVSLRIGKPKQPLFQEIILLIPEAEGDIHEAVRIRDTRDTVLSPAERPRSGVFMGKVAPSISVLRVVLSHSRPLSLRYVRPKLFPVLLPLMVFSQSLLFFTQVFMLVCDHHCG